MILKTPGDLTADWLSEVLGTQVSSWTADPVGTGQNAQNTADNAATDRARRRRLADMRVARPFAHFGHLLHLLD